MTAGGESLLGLRAGTSRVRGRRFAVRVRAAEMRRGTTSGRGRRPQGGARGPRGIGGRLVLVACSGGADSLALAAALAFVAPRLRAAGRAADRRPRAAGGLGRARSRGRRGSRRRSGWGRPRRSPSPSARRAARRPRPGTPDTRRWPRPPSGWAPRRCCSVTRGTTRPRPCCCGLARGQRPGPWPGWPPAAGRYRRPLLELARERHGGACAALGLARGTTRTTPTRRYTRVAGTARGAAGAGAGARAGGGRGAGPYGAACSPGRRRRAGRWAGRPVRDVRSKRYRRAVTLAVRGAGEGCRRARAAAGAAAGGDRGGRAVRARCGGARRWRWSAWSPHWHGQKALDLPGGVWRPCGGMAL